MSNYVNWVDILAPPASAAFTETYTGLQALLWVKKNCPTYLTNDAVQKGGQYYYRFYFAATPAGDQDRTIFALRWT
jgi:hypothetical protein